MNMLIVIGVVFLLVAAWFYNKRRKKGGGNSLPAQTEVITGVTFDKRTMRQMAKGSDNWPITWAANDHQYAAWGDGGGFGGSNTDGRVSLGFARIEGPWNSYKGLNVNGGKNPGHPSSISGKSYGLVAIDRVFHMWVMPDREPKEIDVAKMWKSSDFGASWQPARWAFRQSDGFGGPTILNFGKDYAGARDDYVYTYFVNIKHAKSMDVQKPGEIVLARAHKDKLMERGAYEFYSGGSWSADPKKRTPVFKDPRGCSWNPAVSYNAGLRQYILTVEHSKAMGGNLGMYAAPEPWGPWRKIADYNNWLDTGTTFFWNFSNKWTDGKTFTLVFTGTGKYDAWNTVRGRFVTRPK